MSSDNNDTNELPLHQNDPDSNTQQQTTTSTADFDNGPDTYEGSRRTSKLRSSTTQQQQQQQQIPPLDKELPSAVKNGDSNSQSESSSIRDEDSGEDSADDEEQREQVPKNNDNDDPYTKDLQMRLKDEENLPEDELLLDEDQESTMQSELQSALAFFNQQAEVPGADTDINFTRVHSEYERIHKLFSKSRANEKKLVRRCKELTSELQANAAKVQAALKMSQNDRSTITGLRKEVRKAWKMVEAGTEKETRAKEAINSMKSEIEMLKKNSEMAGSSPPSSASRPAAPTGFGRQRNLDFQMDQEESIKELLAAKEQLTKEVEAANSEIKILREDVNSYEAKMSNLLSERGSLDHDVLNLKDLLATKKSELDREIRTREKLEVQLKTVTETSNKKDGEIQSRSAEIKQLKEQLAKNDIIITEERTRYTKFEKENENILGRLNRVQQEYDEQVMNISSLLSDNQHQSRELKYWEEEVIKYKDELRNATRIRDSLAKRIKLVEEAKLETEFERDALKGINHNVLHDLELARKDLDVSHKQIEGLKRERDIAQKNFVRATAATQKQLGVVKLSEQTKRNLEQEIMGYKDEASKMRKLIYSLEKDRDRHINEASKSEQNLNSKEEEIKIKEMYIFDTKKKITEMEKKLKEQQSMYETVRAERNLYSKNSIELQDEITEMKRKLRIMGHQIEQLKEEISNKEQALGKEKFEHQQLEKEKESLSIQIGKLQQQHEDSQKMIRNQQAEENKLRHIITETDGERLRQKKEYEAVVQERDILGTQLIRRNDELSLLYEKIKIQTTTLNKGELQYRERLEDIRVLRLEIKKLRREKAILQTETQNVQGLRNEIFNLQREVLREMTRVKVLEEELESPMNIHRWRKLSGSDPSTFELITKIQTLQKRLISKTEEVVEKELVITQKEKLYKEIKDVLQRQPGPEIAEELRVVKDAVKVKVRECKALASELNMYHSQVNEYKYEIERLTKDLQEVKRKYYDFRKKGDNGRKDASGYDMGPGGNVGLLLKGNTPSARRAGGGFKYSSTTTKTPQAVDVIKYKQNNGKRYSVSSSGYQRRQQQSADLGHNEDVEPKEQHYEELEIPPPQLPKSTSFSEHVAEIAL